MGEQGTLERELFSDGDIVVLATSDYTETDSECVIVGSINSADEEELTRIAMETEEEREVLSDETLFEPGLTEDNAMEAVEWSSLSKEEDCPANRPNIEVVDLTGSGGEEEEGVAVADNAQQQRWYPPVCPPDAPCGDSCYCYCLNCREHQPYSGGQCKCVLRRGPISWSDEEGSYSRVAQVLWRRVAAAIAAVMTIATVAMPLTTVMVGSHPCADPTMPVKLATTAVSGIAGAAQAAMLGDDEGD